MDIQFVLHHKNYSQYGSFICPFSSNLSEKWQLCPVDLFVLYGRQLDVIRVGLSVLLNIFTRKRKSVKSSYSKFQRIMKKYKYDLHLL